jgi:O-antigen ligase/tetratricopeptide (TPR) repeat protein
MTTRRSNGMLSKESIVTEQNESTGQSLFFRLVDWGLIALLVLAPLFMGGRHPLGELIYVALIGFIAICWIAGQCAAARSVYRFTGAEWLIVSSLLLVGLQIVAVPLGVLESVSPGLADALPLWHESGGIGIAAWTTLSVAPHQTLSGLTILAAYCMLFTVLAQRLRTMADVEWLLRWVVVAVVFMAVIGIVQFLAGDGRFLWVYEHPFRSSSSSAMGSFQNRNHFAHILALGAGPLIWCLWYFSRNQQTSKTNGWGNNSSADATKQVAFPMVCVGAAITAIAVLLSLSRGGLLTFTAASLVCTVLCYWRSLIGPGALAGIVGVAVMSGAGAIVYGTEEIEHRFESASTAKSIGDLSLGREQIWETVLRAVPDFIGLGSGVGTHRYVYPRYISENYTVEFSHAENGYLQILLETGVVGITLLGLGILTCLWWCFRAWSKSPSQSHAACVAAVTSGILASLFHSFGDFVWYIPACMTLAIFLIAAARQLHQEAVRQDGGRTFKLPRFVWAGGTIALCGILFLMVQIQVPAAMASADWDQFQRTTLSNRNQVIGDDSDTLDERIKFLQNVIDKDPDNAKAHLNLASLLRLQFDAEQSKSGIPMPLAQIRDAANTSPFETREALDSWLGKILAERREFLDRSLSHARQAVALCPLQGEAYIFMAELNFLRESNRDHELALIDQALRTRPEAPPVLITAGREALLAGDNETGLAHFKKVFTLGGNYQSLVIQALGRQNADFFFEQFSFDTPALQTLRGHYAGIGNREQSHIVGLKLAKNLVEQATAESGATAAATWSRAQSAFVFLQDESNALQAARNAVASEPHEYGHRKNLVNLLVSQKKFDEAVPLLEWCLKKYPENTKLKEMLLQARSQIQQASFTTDSTERE